LSCSSYTRDTRSSSACQPAASGALASRFLVFNTRASFYGKEKPELFEQELKPELPGILLWALEGLRRYRERGQLSEPECSMELRKHLEHDGSPVLAFVEECLELNASAEVRKDVLYKAWKGFAERESLPTLALPVFMRELLAATNGQAHPCKLSDKARTPAVRGLRLRDELPLEGGVNAIF